MRPLFTTVFCALLLATMPAMAAAAKPDGLAPIAKLIGDWTGVSEGEPGTAATTRHATRAQNDHFVFVEGRSVYPKQDKNKSGEIHTQLDVWSYDKARKLIVLRQFDSLGFASTYVQDKAASINGKFVLVSEHLENVPAGLKARYTFEFKGTDEYHELFELDENGKGFQTYVSGRFLRSPK
jgi:hypothetical protein